MFASASARLPLAECRLSRSPRRRANRALCVRNRRRSEESRLRTPRFGFTETIVMNPRQERSAYLTRRQFFSKSALGLGTAALASLLNKDLLAAGASAGMSPAARYAGLPDIPHFAPKAKRV